MTKCCINITPLDVSRETLQLRLIIIRNQLQVVLGGGIKNINKTRVDLTIQNFELNNLTLTHMYEIKRYEYFKNK